MADAQNRRRSRRGGRGGYWRTNEEPWDEEEASTVCGSPEWIAAQGEGPAPGRAEVGAAAEAAADNDQTWTWPPFPKEGYNCCAPHKVGRGRDSLKYQAFAAATDGCVKHLCEAITQGFDLITNYSDSGVFNVLDFAVYERQNQNKNTYEVEEMLRALGMELHTKPAFPLLEDLQ
jgi:hypothetical protein